MVHPVGQFVLPAAAKDVISALVPLLSEQRLKRIEHVVAGRLRSVIAVLEEVYDPHNASAVLRTAEAFGTQEVHFIEHEPRFSAASRVTQGTDRWLDIVHHGSSQECVHHLHERGYVIFVADGNATDAISLREIASRDKVAVVFGNEHSGVSQEVRALVDGEVAIPMGGFVESLNLSVAAAVVLHALTQDRSGDLSDEDMQQLKARFMCLSVINAEIIVMDYLRRRMALNKTA